MPKKIGGLIICATLSSAANAVILGNIDLDTYNDDYDYTMTKFATNLSIPSNYDCDESFSNLFDKYGDTDESYCKVETTGGRKFYCFGLSYTGASVEASLPECANTYCNDPSEYAVWERTGAAQGQKFYGCAKYFPGSNCYSGSGETEQPTNPSMYPDIFSYYAIMSYTTNPIECNLYSRARPDINGNCEHPERGLFQECYCAYEKSYYFSGDGEPNDSGKITLRCNKCPDNANCNGGLDTFSCKAGYYRPSPRVHSCYNCPSASSDIIDFCDTQPTSPGGSTSITQCYLPTSTMCKDIYGTFSIVNGNCNYSN